MYRYNDKRVFYCYILFDAWGIPRYVGKGQGNRWNDHERCLDLFNPRKQNFIDLTVTILGEVPRVKVRENVSEQEAFDTEIALIKALGRHPDGLLYNILRGGPLHDSETIKDSWQRLTPEERKIRIEKQKRGIANASTTEERSARRRAIELARPLSVRKAKAAYARSFLPKEAAIRGGRASGSANWINNGVINKRIKKGSNIPEGWKPGRLYRCEKFIYNTKGTIWINNGLETKRHKTSSPVPDGWVQGRKAKLNFPTCLCGCGQPVSSLKVKWKRGHVARGPKRIFQIRPILKRDQ